MLILVVMLQARRKQPSFVAGYHTFLMGILGMGSIFWLCPVVWPFMVSLFLWFRFVMLFEPVLGCIATLIPWVISEFNHGAFAVDKQSPKDHQKEGKLKFHDWTETTVGGIAWNFTWLFVPGCPVLFPIIVSCVHYPRCFVARGVLHSSWAVVFGSLFFFLAQSPKAVGLNGCFANAIGPNFGAEVSGTFKTASSGNKITIASGGVQFGTEVKFETNVLMLKFNGRELKSGGTITIGNTSKIVLFGTNNNSEEIQSLKMDFSGSSATLDVNNSTENEHKLKNTSEITLSVSGSGKAGGFTGAATNYKLTKIVFSDCTLSSLEIDGYSLTANATLTLVFANERDYSSGFDVSGQGFENGFMKSGISFPDAPFDLANGPIFGTVSFNFSLFHLTAALFTAQAYSVGIGSFKIAVDSGCSWPTQGIGGFRSFCWWLNYGLKNGYRGFRGLADVDIVSVIS